MFEIVKVILILVHQMVYLFIHERTYLHQTSKHALTILVPMNAQPAKYFVNK